MHHNAALYRTRCCESEIENNNEAWLLIAIITLVANTEERSIFIYLILYDIILYFFLYVDDLNYICLRIEKETKRLEEIVVI